MARLNTKTAVTNKATGLSPVKTTGETTLTAEGGTGYLRDAKSELLITAVSTLNEDTFYEDSDARLDRIEKLVKQVASDGEWVLGLVSWLRNDVGLRSVPAIIAANAVHARLADAGNHEDTDPNGGTVLTRGYNRAIVTAAIGRADETADFLAYWLSRYGRPVPSAVKRGLSDALDEKLSETSWLKWRGRAANGAVSLRDVLNITRAKPADDHQSALYAAVIEDGYGRPADDTLLPIVRARREFLALSPDEQVRLLSSSDADTVIKNAKLTHEVIAGAIGKIPAPVWEHLVPNMGYTALRMNLRRISEAGVSDDLIAVINKTLADEKNVEKSKTMPIGFLAAYKNAPLEYAAALQKGANGALKNVPELKGSTLILVDSSGSMGSRLSEHSSLSFSDASNIFGAALALRAERPTLVSFNHDSRKIDVDTPDLLRLVEKMPGASGGTNTKTALDRWYDGQDRVVIITDEQWTDYSYGAWLGLENDSDDSKGLFSSVPRNVPVFTWNLVGYRVAQAEAKPGRYTFGGLTDKGFQLIPLLEKGFKAGWPWE